MGARYLKVCVLGLALAAAMAFFCATCRADCFKMMCRGDNGEITAIVGCDYQPGKREQPPDWQVYEFSWGSYAGAQLLESPLFVNGTLVNPRRFEYRYYENGELYVLDRKTSQTVSVSTAITTMEQEASQ